MINKNPFSLYDFLGYFVPGAMIIYIVLIIEYIKKAELLNLKDALSSINDINTNSALFLILIAYILGHFLSYISSITIEQYSNWKYDYPSKYLLLPNTRNFWDKTKSFHCYFWRITLIISLFPMVFLDLILGKYFGFKKFYHKRIDNELISLIINKINILSSTLGIVEDSHNGKGNDSDFHRLVHHYVYENSKNHQHRLDNYVAIYGFLRTMTLVFIILFWYVLFHSLLFCKMELSIYIFLLVNSLFIYVFFMAFMKFYRRYTLEGLMALAILKIE